MFCLILRYSARCLGAHEPGFAKTIARAAESAY